MAASGLPLHENKFLVGNLEPIISGDQLPSKRQVLQVLFYTINIINPRKNIRLSATAVIEQVKAYWTRAQLPIQNDFRCIEKLLRLHKEWSNLQKNAGKTSNHLKENLFSSALVNLFDIAAADIENQIDQRQNDFLENQRHDGRVGFISEIENYFEQQEANKIKLNELMARRLQKSQMEINLIGKIFLKSNLLLVMIIIFLLFKNYYLDYDNAFQTISWN